MLYRSLIVIGFAAALAIFALLEPAASQSAGSQFVVTKRLRPADEADANFHARFKKAFQTRDSNWTNLLRYGLQQGYPSAYAEAGAIVLESGETAKGIAMIRAAAEAGLPSAMALMGIRALNEHRAAEGHDWLRRAARLGDVNARSMCEKEKLSC